MFWRPIAGSRLPDSNLYYSIEESTFFSHPADPFGSIYCYVESLTFVLDAQQVVRRVEGFVPLGKGRATGMVPPDHMVARIQIVTDAALDDGEDHDWERYFQGWKYQLDPETGWVCFGDASHPGPGMMFAPGSVVVLNEGTPVALWLKYQPVRL